ncbi:protein-export chaperone SecB [Neisseriaceae bacterium B1]
MSEQQAVQQEQQPIFSVEKIYLKDLSLEVPHAPKIFLEQETPEVDMRISTESGQIEDDFYECTVTVTVTAKLSDGRVVFLNEASQAGIFRIEGVAEEDVKLLLGVACPNILFPYAREVVSSAITRAGFPPVILAPINFEAMYNQANEQVAQ